MSGDPVPIGRALGGLTVEQIIGRARDGTLPPEEGPDPECIDTLNVEQWRRRCPRRFWHANITELADEAAELVGWALNDMRCNVLITGPVGTGKTHAALAAAHVWNDQQRGFRFWPVVELLDALRPGGSYPDDVADVPLLVLDDLGAERPTDWTWERLYLVINRRWLNELPTIVTTNLAPDALRTTVGDRLYSRLTHDAIGVRLAGADRRRQEAT